MHTKMFVFFEQDVNAGLWCGTYNGAFVQTLYFVNLLFLLLQATICLSQLMNKTFFVHLVMYASLEKRHLDM